MTTENDAAKAGRQVVGYTVDGSEVWCGPRFVGTHADELAAELNAQDATIRELREAVEVLAAAVASVKDRNEAWPELTTTMTAGLFCGVEDKDIRDRYEAARYGYDDALERCEEFIQNAVADVEKNPIAAAAIERSRA